MDIKSYKTKAEPKGMAGSVPVFCAHDKIAKVKDLRPNPKNPNKHPQDQIALLAKIIMATGWRAPITVSANSGYIVKGHGRYMAALAGGLEEAPVDIQHYTNKDEEYADLVADNRLAELSNIDNTALADIFSDFDLDEIPAELTGYNDKEFADVLAALENSLQDLAEDIDATPEPAAEVITRPGDIWTLGKHRVLCGDCTAAENREKLFAGVQPEILLTDPPYCSGGFQESGRRAGSKGTDAKDESNRFIANDTLSTRGYQSLIKQVLTDIPPKVVYIFTDWRMWVYLFDIVEGAGYGVKSMIVWNKKTPGMGMGWRAQHELIVFAHKAKPRWDNHKGYGNVLDVTRQQNALHPTQKPVELLAKILDNTAWARGVFDPFLGSGTTLIACEQAGQTCYGIELEARHVDTIVRRYIATTGNTDVALYRNGSEQPREVIAPILLAAEMDQ